MTTSLSDLLAELQAAREGSRELDAKIATVLELKPRGSWRPCADLDPATFAVSACVFWKAPEYTRSIDAAMLLVPEGMQVVLTGPWQDSSGPEHRWWEAFVADNVTEIDFTGDGGWEGATLPLALVIACIRARLTLGEKEKL